MATCPLAPFLCGVQLLEEEVSAQGGDSSVKPVVGQHREVVCHLISPNVSSRAGKAASSTR